MLPEDLRAYANRDWGAVAELKAQFWAERKSRMSVTEALDLSDALRRQAIAWKPTWPSEADRREDLDTHARVSAALRNGH